MFKFVHEDEDFKVTLEVGDSVITHDKVAEYFTNFLRGCGFVFDSLAQHRLVDDNGNVLPSFEERYNKLMADIDYFGDTTNEDGQGTFPVI